MKSIAVGVCVACLVAGGLWAQNSINAKKLSVESPSWSVAVEKGARWLASVQGADGGWGQDGWRDVLYPSNRAPRIHWK